MAGYMVAGGESGICSLIPTMQSDEQSGVKVSYTPYDDARPAWWAFDGTFDGSGSPSVGDRWIASTPGKNLVVDVEFSSPKALYYACDVFGSYGSYGWSSTKTVRYSDDGASFYDYGSVAYGSSPAFLESEAAKHKYYRFTFKQIGSTGVLLQELQLFGK